MRTASVLCPLIGLALAPSASAAFQNPAVDQENVSFTTGDGAQLRGHFYPGPDGRKSAAVLLLPHPGHEGAAARWEELAAQLQKEHRCAGLLFDYRGHGRSTAVRPEFWDVEANQRGVRGYVRSRPADAIAAKDFLRGYAPALVNDVAAARTFLEQRNDAGECNTRQLIVIGEGDGAALGALWLGCESFRFRVLNRFTGERDDVPESADVVDAVWLGLRPQLEGRAAPVLDWFRAANRARPTPMGFLHEADDRSAAGFARTCERLLGTGSVTRKSVPDAKGGDSLLASAETRESILKYVGRRLEDDPRGWKERDFDDRRYLWSHPRFGSYLAKDEGETSFRVIPPEWVMRP